MSIFSIISHPRLPVILWCKYGKEVIRMNYIVLPPLAIRLYCLRVGTWTILVMVISGKNIMHVNHMTSMVRLVFKRNFMSVM